MSKAKEILEKIRAIFDGMPPAPPAPPAPPLPPPGVDYTLNDGTKITIQQKGDVPAVGDICTINGAPAAGMYVLADNSTLTTDATGAITAITPGTPVTVDPNDMGKNTPPAPPAPVVPPAKFEMTPEGAKAYLDAFDTGTPEDQITNLKIVCKALMEYCFGWQIRDAERKAVETQAIEVYKTGLAAAETKLVAQEATIKKQEEKLQGLFSLTEELAALPTADPKTQTGPKREKFEKAEKAEEKFKKINAALQKAKQDA